MQLFPTRSLRRAAPRVSFSALLALAASGVMVAACASPAFDDDVASTDEQAAVAAASGLWPATNAASEAERHDVPVCFLDDGFDEEKRVVREAVEASWPRYSTVRFTGWGKCWTPYLLPGKKVTIRGMKVHLAPRWVTPGVNISFADARPWSVVGVSAYASYPSMVMSSQFGWSKPSPDGKPNLCQLPGNRLRCIAAYAVHEFGHAIGFFHEHERGDEPPAYHAAVAQAIAETKPTIPPDAVPLGDWDPFSVMNYLNPGATFQTTLSSGDVAAVRKLYGRKPSGALVAPNATCLEAKGSLLLPNAACTGVAAQSFTLDVPTPAPAIAPEYSTLRVGGRCVGGSEQPSGLAAVGPCLSVPDDQPEPTQAWKLEEITLRDYAGRCLEVAPVAGFPVPPALAPVQIATCAMFPPAEQRWSLRRDGTLRGALRDALNGPMCLSVNAVTHGLHQATCTPNALSPTRVPEQGFTLTRGGEIKGSNGECLTSASSSIVTGGGIAMRPCDGSVSQKFFVTGRLAGVDGAGLVSRFGGAEMAPLSGPLPTTWDYYP